MNHPTSVAGILIIIVGTVLLLANITDIGAGKIWPFIVLAPALYFIALYREHKSMYGLFMPISILVISSGIFFYCAFYGWYQMQYLWPLFIAAPGIGFLLMYTLGQKEKVFLILSLLLIGLGTLFILITLRYDAYWPVLLILAGLYLLLRKK